MKKFKRLSALLILLCMMLSMLSAISVFTVSADDDDNSARYTQKVVSVVFDNSGSMTSYNREPLARYSLEMLMALLNERDEMIIMPMNDGRTGYPVDNASFGIEVNLSAKDRDAELDRIMALPQLQVNPGGAGTPPQSMGYAVECLEKKGLTKSGSQDDVDREYWLVILTDGEFAEVPGQSYGDEDDKIKHYIKDYPNLHTVYAGFGGGVDLSKSSKLSSYQFYPYLTTEKDLAATIQQIANKVSGRYTLDGANYVVNGKTLTINLENLPISLSSLSLVVQDCGAKVSSVTLDGKKLNVEKGCVIKPNSVLKMKDGYSCEIMGDPYLSGGTMVFEFTSSIDKNKIAIFAEPALKISYYFEAVVNGAWQKVDVPYIINNLGKGDNIRVGYEVYEQANNTLIDLEQVFGEVDAKVFYVNKYYKTGENIPLVAGVHDISIDVSVMDGAYTLRATETLMIEEDPAAFRIEVSGDSEFPKGGVETTAVFTVFIKNLPATADQLKNYTYSITATSPMGYPADVKTTVGADGRISAKLKIEQNNFDVYTLEMTIESAEGLKRTKSHSVTLIPNSLDLAVNGSDHLSITQYELESNTDSFNFSLTTNGLPFPINNSFSKYKLMVDGVDLTDNATVSGNTLSFIPTAENLGAMVDNPGDKEVELILESATHPHLNTSVKATLTIIKTVYTINTVGNANKSFDRFDLANADATIYFSVLRDGISLTDAELKEAYESGKIQFKLDSTFTFFPLPAGVVTSLETVDGTPVIAVKVVKDMARYFEWHYSAFIKGGDKTVTATYKDAEKIDCFTVLPSETWQHVLRILCLIIAHIIFLYIVAYIISFFFVKPLPSCVLYKMTGDYFSAAITINGSVFGIIKWHLLRFITIIHVFSHQSIEPYAKKLNPYGINLGFDGSDITYSVSDGGFYKLSTKPGKAQSVMGKYKNELRNDRTNYTIRDAMIHHHFTPEKAEKLFTKALNPIAINTDPISLSADAVIGKYTVRGRASVFNYSFGYVNLQKNDN